MSVSRHLFLAACLLPAWPLMSATTRTSQPTTLNSQPTTLNPQPTKLVATDADIDFAMRCADSAIRQYGALPEAKKKKLEVQVAKAAGVQDVNVVSQTMRTLSSQIKDKPISTKENRASVKAFLNANPKWCGTVKAARLGQQAMQKMGMKGEMSLEDMLNMIPE